VEQEEAGGVEEDLVEDVEQVGLEEVEEPEEVGDLVGEEGGNPFLPNFSS
jgi:hypothetical protein